MVAPELQPGYGDRKLIEVRTGTKEPRTGHLGLHVVSTHLTRRDVFTVLSFVLEVERTMHGHQLLFYDLGRRRAAFRDEVLSLDEILSRISSEIGPA